MTVPLYKSKTVVAAAIESFSTFPSKIIVLWLEYGLKHRNFTIEDEIEQR